MPPRLALFGDERLARLAGDGGERAFAALYERYHQPLYRYCHSILRDEADAQDALQSAFAGALAALQRGQRDAPLRPWLFRIAHNEAVSLLRRRRFTVELPEAVQERAPSAAERAEGRDRLSLLVSDLRELADRQRGALLMRELSGLSHEEIALALGTSVGVAKQTIFEARRALLEFAEGRAMVCEQVRRTISDGDGRVLRGRRVRGHLRDCSGCAAFAAAIPARREDLQALAPPLAPVAAAGLLTRLLGASSGHGSDSAGIAAGAAGKSVGATLAGKTLVGVVLLTAATVGVTDALALMNTRQALVAPAAQAPSAGRAARTSSASGPVPTAGHAKEQATARAGGHHRSHHTATASHAQPRAQTPLTSSAVGVMPGGAARGGSSSQAHATPTRDSMGSRPANAGSRGLQHPRAHPSVPASSGPDTAGASAPSTVGGGVRPQTSAQTDSGTPASSKPAAPLRQPPVQPSGAGEQAQGGGGNDGSSRGSNNPGSSHALSNPDPSAVPRVPLSRDRRRR